MGSVHFINMPVLKSENVFPQWAVQQLDRFLILGRLPIAVGDEYDYMMASSDGNSSSDMTSWNASIFLAIG